MAEETAHQKDEHGATTAKPKETQPREIKPLGEDQTVCNEKNEKGQLCTGHLKRMMDGGAEVRALLARKQTVLRCQKCGQMYVGEPLLQLRPVVNSN